MPGIREEDFLKKQCFSLYDLYGYTLAQDPGGHEIYNFGSSFIGYHYYTLSLSDLPVEKMLKKTMHFHYMTCMATFSLHYLCVAKV